ncbi:MAG TPA: heme lyase CcmF/NrfE family subunit [Acidobacteriota bacterium]
MAELGGALLDIALFTGAFSILSCLLSVALGDARFARAARNGVWLQLGLFSAAVVCLEYLFMTCDFSVAYVAENSSRDMNAFYTIASLWGGQAGSLLFWGWILAIYAGVVAWQNRSRLPDLMPWVYLTLLGTLMFFNILVTFVADPFEHLGFTPPDGRGLNPLLQNPGMVYHPPLLYLGYVGMTVPFAFAVAALATRQIDERWITLTRRWMLFAWAALGVGILLGAHWAYVELGWGGFWAWDPVENASFMPWLLATALLHSIMIQEKKRMLRIWNVVLVSLCFIMAIFGTFLTRSGIITSVHTFTQSSIGSWFLGFLALVILSCAALIATRLEALRSRNRLESFVSRESSFMFNNWIFLAMTFTVLWGTTFPVLSEAVRGVKITVGPPFFNAVMGPIGLALLLLTGVGPLIAWRKASLGNLRRNFSFPLGLMAGVMALLWAANPWGLRHTPASLFSFGLCAFVVGAIGLEFHRGARSRSRGGEGYVRALGSLLARNQRRYGGYVVHLGIVCIMVGITGSVFQTESSATLKVGDSFRIKDYELRLDHLHVSRNDTAEILATELAVMRNGVELGTLIPEKRFYERQDQLTTEVAIYSTPKEDLYIVPASVNEDSSAVFKAYVNPLVMWLWIGGVILCLGTTIVMWPELRS